MRAAWLIARPLASICRASIAPRARAIASWKPSNNISISLCGVAFEVAVSSPTCWYALASECMARGLEKVAANIEGLLLVDLR